MKKTAVGADDDGLSDRDVRRIADEIEKRMLLDRAVWPTYVPYLVPTAPYRYPALPWNWPGGTWTYSTGVSATIAGPVIFSNNRWS